jgi:hypothetical protein
VIPTDYFEKLTAHQCHVINLHQKHDDLSGQIGSKDELSHFLYADQYYNWYKKIKISYSQHNRT